MKTISSGNGDNVKTPRVPKQTEQAERQTLVQTMGLALTARDDGVAEDAMWRAQALLMAVKAKDHVALLKDSIDSLTPAQRRSVASPRMAELVALVGLHRASSTQPPASRISRP